jgi:CheY-like chemotaxis protein
MIYKQKTIPMSYVRTALLVEDSPDDSFFFQRALKQGSTPCDLQHVTDGRMAIDFLRECQSKPGLVPDIIFLDLKMPILNGFEVLEWLRSQPPMPATLVVVLSGSNEESDKRRAKELGAAGYIVKPVLSAQICGWLEKIDPHRAQQRRLAASEP